MKVPLISVLCSTSAKKPRLCSWVLPTRRKVSISTNSHHLKHPNTRSSYLPDIRPDDPQQYSGDVYESARELANWFHGKRNVLCITGAGMSTSSGIPDYRGHDGSYYKNHVPTNHQEFMTKEYARQRYWSRSLGGWKQFAMAEPNEGHFALAKLEQMNQIGVTYDDSPLFYSNDTSLDDFYFSNGSKKLSIITQNVDRLDFKAGSQYVMPLHGRNDVVVCQSCFTSKCRHEYHHELQTVNAHVLSSDHHHHHNHPHHRVSSNMAPLRPDGDADWNLDRLHDFQVPSCTQCAADGKLGILKPNVVFFGDSVPKSRVEEAYAAVNACDGLFVIGSSLAVHSAFRFVNHAHVHQKPIAILNMGETRAEKANIPVLKVEAPISSTLVALVELLGSTTSGT